jgi:hypothetical protein
VAEDIQLILLVFIDAAEIKDTSSTCKFNICVNQMVVLLYFTPLGYFWLSYVSVKENVGA